MPHECEAPKCEEEADVQAPGGEWFCGPHAQELGL